MLCQRQQNLGDSEPSGRRQSSEELHDYFETLILRCPVID